MFLNVQTCCWTFMNVHEFKINIKFNKVIFNVTWNKFLIKFSIFLVLILRFFGTFFLFFLYNFLFFWYRKVLFLEKTLDTRPPFLVSKKFFLSLMFFWLKNLFLFNVWCFLLKKKAFFFEQMILKKCMPNANHVTKTQKKFI